MGRMDLAADHQGRRGAPVLKSFPVLPGHDRRAATLVVSLVAMTTGVAAEGIAARGRRKNDAMARQIAMYLTHVGLNWPLTRVGAAFGRDRSTAAHACHRVEDLRDDPAFDARMNDLEAWLRSAPAGYN